MNFRLKIAFIYFLIHLGLNTTAIISQTKSSKEIIQEIKELYRFNKLDTVITLTNKVLKNTSTLTSKDSLLFAKLYLYKFMGLHNTNKSLKNILSLHKGISYCPNSHTGDSLKAVLYNKKAYLESELDIGKKSYKSITKSLQLLESLPNPNTGYIMGAYLLLSSQHVYYGNYEKAKHYIRLAEEIYAKHKVQIDKNTWELNGNHHRLGVIAKYRYIYMLYKAKNPKNRHALLKTMKALEKMYHQPDFHQEERIYYTTALNHIGDWFISHNPDSLTTQNDVSLGLKYLFKTHNLVENKGYYGTLWSIKYNIAKGFIRGNKLEKADSVMAVLFKGISKTDGRLPFFYAQKGLIKAKKKQKDSALIYFDKSIKKIHQHKNTLNTDYSNFTPSKSYNHTSLLLRISEELNNYYSKDSLVQKKVGKLYYMALQQFENSYLKTSFNTQQNKQIRQIIHGILRTRKMGSIDNNLPQKTILNKFETIKNQLEWKKFNESRFTNTLPELDIVKQRNIELASLLNKATIANNITKKDSIQNLINIHNSYKASKFPQLELLSDAKFSIEKLQQELTEKELILKYILLENEIAIYQISKTDFKVSLHAWSAKEKSHLNTFIEKIHNRDYNSKLGVKFAQLLFPDLQDTISHIIINPDGMLFNLPFEVLQLKDQFATEIYNFSYTSNLGFINFTSDKITASNNIHIYAPNYVTTTTNSSIRNKPSFLKGASNEAKSISKLFPSKLFNDKSLTKYQFIKTAEKAKILHLAMHADVNKDYPELSRLLFNTNLEKENEHLYLEELYGLSLGADLAILSACNTGGGLEKNGSLESFQRAFTFAGVPATVASLWEVPDASTEKIMVLFYKNLKAGQTKSIALKNAKLSYRKENVNSKLASPYYWAGFVVYGSNTPITQTSNTLLYLLIIVFVLVFFFILRKSISKLT